MTQQLYTVWRIAYTDDGLDYFRYRKNIDRETLEKVRDKVANFKNPSMKCKYYVVKIENDEAFEEKCYGIYCKRREAWEKRQAKKAQRWDELSAAYVKGYKVRDTIAYINS